jgi:hypothetical protein
MSPAELIALIAATAPSVAAVAVAWIKYRRPKPRR